MHTSSDVDQPTHICRRKKSAAERRQQRDRASGKHVQWMLKTLLSLHHRGNALSKCAAVVKEELLKQKRVPSNSGNSGNLRTTVLCKHYAAGYCKRGNDCGFSHELDGRNIHPFAQLQSAATLASSLQPQAEWFVPSSVPVYESLAPEVPDTGGSLVFSAGAFVPSNGTLVEIPARRISRTVDLTSSSVARTDAGFDDVSFPRSETVEESHLVGSNPFSSIASAQSSEHLETPCIQNDAITLNFAYETKTVAVTVQKTAPLRSAVQLACKKLDVDPCSVEVHTPERKRLRVHRNSEELGLRSFSHLLLETVVIDVNNDNVSDQYPWLGVNRPANRWRKPSPLPTPIPSEASDSDGEVIRCKVCAGIGCGFCNPSKYRKPRRSRIK